MKRVITFSGLDGSGKSSLIDRLKTDMPDSKVIHIIHFRVINRLKRKQSSTGGGGARPRKSAISSYINLSLMLFDTLIFNFYVLFSKRSIICDRYFYDLIASNAYRYGPSMLSRFVLFLARKPDMAFFIDVEPEQALLREQDDNHDISYFKTLRKIYEQEFISTGTFKVVENKDLDHAYQQIKKLVEDLS